MKRLLILAFTLTSLSAFAQGHVGFPNYLTEPISISGTVPVSGSVTTTISGKPTVDAALTVPVQAQEQDLESVLTSTLTSFTWDMQQYNSFTVQLNNYGAGPSTRIIVSTSNDNRVFTPVQVELITGSANGSTQGYKSLAATGFGLSNYGPMLVGGPKYGRYMRVTVSSSITNVAVNVHLSTSDWIPRQADLLSNQDARWDYKTAAGGITTTSNVTLKAGDSNAFKQILRYLKIQNAGTAGTEYTILDGASTALYRGYISAGATDTLNDIYLVSSIASSIQFAIASATNVQIYIYAQGFQAN